MMDFILDLQLFSDDRKEPATPRRRQMAREKGQIPQSTELVSAVGFLAGFFALRFAMYPVVRFLAARCRDLWAAEIPAEPSIGWAMSGLRYVLSFSLVAVAPVTAAVALAGLAVSVAQSGLGFRPSLLQPQMDRVNPLTGLKRLFSRRSFAQLIRSVAKVSLIMLVAWTTLRNALPEVASSLVRQLPATLTLTQRSIERVALNCGIFLVILGIIDYIYQWWENERGMMMTTKEVRDEMRDTEIKPEIKSAMRQRQRAIARRRMMQEVPSADVVVVNPTHYAVALRYDVDKDVAPVVAAKGMDHIALRIKEIARESGVEIVTDPPLARSLFKAADVGEAIPEELYKAVAEILAYVYRVSGTRRAAG